MNENVKKIITIILIVVIVLIILLSIKFNSRNTVLKDTENLTQNNMQEVNTETKIVSNEEENNIILDNSIKDVQNIIATNDTENKNTDNSNSIRTFGENVAFIGDSRTQAFLMYAGLKDVQDYTNVGLMVDTAITKKFITNDDGEKITILDDLKKRNINTIYIMLGINELGWIYSEIFINKYEELINKIYEVKPNCEIILQSIIPVTATKSKNDKVYNNNKILEYNKLIKDMADRKGIKHIDLCPALTDENGCLPEEASTDGIHLNKEYCIKWLNCLK